MALAKFALNVTIEAPDFWMAAIQSINCFRMNLLGETKYENPIFCLYLSIINPLQVILIVPLRCARVVPTFLLISAIIHAL